MNPPGWSKQGPAWKTPANNAREQRRRQSARTPARALCAGAATDQTGLLGSGRSRELLGRSERAHARWVLKDGVELGWIGWVDGWTLGVVAPSPVTRGCPLPVARRPWPPVACRWGALLAAQNRGKVHALCFAGSRRKVSKRPAAPD